MHAEADLAEPDLKNEEESVKWDDPKYRRVRDALIELGFNGTKFIGRHGYQIPDENSYCNLVCSSPKNGFHVRVVMTIATPGEATELAGYLNQYAEMANQLNAILADATTADTKDRHVNESLIQVNDPEYGKPGTYIVYRNGGTKTQRGFISFSSHKAEADKFQNPDDPKPTKCYLVDIKNPFVVSGQTSLGAFRNAYHQLTGKGINLCVPDKKINDAWRDHDKEMADMATKAGYDSIIYLVPNATEVLVLGTDMDKIPAISDYSESGRHVVEDSTMNPITEGLVNESQDLSKLVKADVEKELLSLMGISKEDERCKGPNYKNLLSALKKLQKNKNSELNIRYLAYHTDKLGIDRSKFKSVFGIDLEVPEWVALKDTEDTEFLTNYYGILFDRKDAKGNLIISGTDWNKMLQKAQKNQDHLKRLSRIKLD